LADMQGRDVGSVRVLLGKCGDEKLYLAATADSKHVSLMLNTCFTTNRHGPNKKRRVGDRLITFQMPEYLHYYYSARHAVDDNNNIRQGSVPFEETFRPDRWDLRQLGFIIALSLANSQLASNHFVQAKCGMPKLSGAEFRRIVAEEILEWCEGQREVSSPGEGAQRSSARRASSVQHALCHIPKGRGKHTATAFKNTKSEYPKYTCTGDGCKKKIRTYCSCDKTRTLCADCFAEHVAST